MALRKFIFGTFTVITSSILLSGCISNSVNSNPGPSVDTLLSQTDIQLADAAASYALENLLSGQRWSWSNPETGNSGLVRPKRTWYVEERGQYCRAYEERITAAERTGEFSDIACRSASGEWNSI